MTRNDLSRLLAIEDDRVRFCSLSFSYFLLRQLIKESSNPDAAPKVQPYSKSRSRGSCLDSFNLHKHVLIDCRTRLSGVITSTTG